VRVVVHEDQACQGRCLSRPRPAAPPAACRTFIDPGPGPRVYQRRDEPSPSITTSSLGITKHTKNTAPDMADGNCMCSRYGRVDGVQVKHTQALPSNGIFENTVMRTVCLDTLHPLRIWLFSQIMRKTITRIQNVRGLAEFGSMSNGRKLLEGRRMLCIPFDLPKLLEGQSSPSFEIMTASPSV